MKGVRLGIIFRGYFWRNRVGVEFEISQVQMKYAENNHYAMRLTAKRKKKSNWTVPSWIKHQPLQTNMYKIFVIKN